MNRASASRGRIVAARIQLITSPLPGGLDALCETVAAAVDAGAGLVQYRRKNTAGGEMTLEARRLAEVCHARDVPLIVNDRLDVALAAEADGVHLGTRDLPWTRARNIAPAPFVLGVTAATTARIRAAIGAGADYAGAGPAFPSETKSDTGPRRELHDYEALAAACAERPGEPLPLVAVGGIGPGRAGPLIAAGCRAVAVSAAVLGAESPASIVEALVREIASASVSMDR